MTPMRIAARIGRSATSAASAPTIAYHGNENVVANWKSPSRFVDAAIRSTVVMPPLKLQFPNEVASTGK